MRDSPTHPADARAQVRRRLLEAATDPPADAGRDEALFRMLVGAWRARHAGLLDLTPQQSRDFFAWVGAFFDVDVPVAESVLVGSWRPFDQDDESILRATLTQVEIHGLEHVELAHVAAAAHLSVGDLISTFGSLDRLLDDQRAHLVEQIHEADVPAPFASTLSVAVDELWRFFDHGAAEAALAHLTLGGLTPSRALATCDAALYTEIRRAPALDPPVLGALLLLDAHRTAPTVGAPADPVAVPEDLARPFVDALSAPPRGET
jgi:hypothetical protein